MHMPKLFCVLLVVAVITPAYAGRQGQSRIYGKTYEEWGAQWWQWAAAGPDGENAVQDETGEFCAVHQPRGKVWFLAGTFGGTDVERTCTIPAGRALFYPLVNTVWTDCPDTEDEDLTDDQVRDILATFMDHSCQLMSTLDGTSISSRQIRTVRTQSPRFTTILPEDPALGAGCEPPLAAGETGRQIADGYWIMLPPLTPGEHILTTHGAICEETGEFFFASGVTYHLTVLDDDSNNDD